MEPKKKWFAIIDGQIVKTFSDEIVARNWRIKNQHMKKITLAKEME